MSKSLNNSVPTRSFTLVEAGQAFYESQLRTELEPSHAGEFVAIEPLAVRYFLGQTATAALVAAHNAMPESKFFLIRIGSLVAHKIRVGDNKIYEHTF
jgi:hypothetical protein